MISVCELGLFVSQTKARPAASGGTRDDTIPRISVLRFPELFVKAHGTLQVYERDFNVRIQNLHHHSAAHQNSFGVNFVHTFTQCYNNKLFIIPIFASA